MGSIGGSHLSMHHSSSFYFGNNSSWWSRPPHYPPLIIMHTLYDFFLKKKKKDHLWGGVEPLVTPKKWRKQRDKKPQGAGVKE